MVVRPSEERHGGQAQRGAPAGRLRERLRYSKPHTHAEIHHRASFSADAPSRRSPPQALFLRLRVLVCSAEVPGSCRSARFVPRCHIRAEVSGARILPTCV